MDEDYQEFIKKYSDFVKEREKRRLNFNRKDRWKQREMDDIFKNFDVQKAKFKDYSKLSQELQIVNKKSMNSINEVFYYLENVFNDGKLFSIIYLTWKGILEEQCSSALDVFFNDIKLFKEENLNNQTFIKFVKQLAQNVSVISNELNFYKIGKFLDWYGVDYRNAWFNLERTITSKRNIISPSILVKTLSHFANQNEGSEEFYDMFQYLFWSSKFDNLNNSDFISLGYSLFITRQGKIINLSKLRLCSVLSRLL